MNTETAFPPSRSDRFASKRLDPHGWILDRYRRYAGDDQQVLLVPTSGRIEIKPVADSPSDASIRLIEGVLKDGDRPSSIITDSSSDSFELRAWLLKRGIGHLVLPKGTLAVERLVPMGRCAPGNPRVSRPNFRNSVPR